MHAPVAPPRIARCDADHELADRGCRCRPSGTAPAGVVPFCGRPVAGAKPAVSPGSPRTPRPTGGGGSAGIAPRATADRLAGSGPGRSGGAAPRSRAGAPGVRHPWTPPPGQHHQTAQQTAREQVDDREDHSAMISGSQPRRPCRHRPRDGQRPDRVIEPHRRGPPRRGVDAVGLENLPYGRRRDLDSKAGQFCVDPAVALTEVPPGQPQDQGTDGLAGGRSAGLAPYGPGGPAASDDVAMPAQYRFRVTRSRKSVAATLRYHTEQRREQGPVRPVQLRAARPPLQDRELVAKDQDFGGLPRLLTPGQPQPCGQSRNQEEHEPQARDR